MEIGHGTKRAGRRGGDGHTERPSKRRHGAEALVDPEVPEDPQVLQTPPTSIKITAKSTEQQGQGQVRSQRTLVDYFKRRSTKSKTELVKQRPSFTSTQDGPINGDN